MNNAQQTARQPSSKRPWLIVVGIICFIFLSLVGWWGYSIYADSQKTYPLGDRLEYIGKDSYGCWIICDSNPSSGFYYATDMNINEVVSYFRKAQLDNPEEIRPQDEGVPISFSLTLPNTQNPLYITYYDNAPRYIHDSKLNLKTTSKPHLITIDSEDYTATKDSL